MRQLTRTLALSVEVWRPTYVNVRLMRALLCVLTLPRPVPLPPFAISPTFLLTCTYPFHYHRPSNHRPPNHPNTQPLIHPPAPTPGFANCQLPVRRKSRLVHVVAHGLLSQDRQAVDISPRMRLRTVRWVYLPPLPLPSPPPLSRKTKQSVEERWRRASMHWADLTCPAYAPRSQRRQVCCAHRGLHYGPKNGQHPRVGGNIWHVCRSGSSSSDAALAALHSCPEFRSIPALRRTQVRAARSP
jgi:hypothetical protein